MKGEFPSFLNPEYLVSIKDLYLRAKVIVEGFLIGYHKSPYHGFSVEFKDHKMYSVSDDIRWIDWKLYARTDKFFVKKFEEETNLRAYILFDTSASMNYPTSPQRGVNKIEYAKSLASSLFYLFYLQRDAFSLYAFNGGVKCFLLPKTSKSHLFRVLKELTKIKAEGQTYFYTHFLELVESIKKRGMIIVISDLMANPEDIIRGITILKKKKHEILVMHILSPEELELKLNIPVRLWDLETREEVIVNPLEVKNTYQQNIRRHIQQLKETFLSQEIEYEIFFTNEGFEKALLAFLRKRERLL